MCTACHRKVRVGVYVLSSAQVSAAAAAALLATVSLVIYDSIKCQSRLPPCSFGEDPFRNQCLYNM